MVHASNVYLLYAQIIICKTINYKNINEKKRGEKDLCTHTYVLYI